MPAGDCRAVLGRSNDLDQWWALSLSRDHNTREPEEQEMLKKKHPGEDDIIYCVNPQACYVKGRLQPTRSVSQPVSA